MIQTYVFVTSDVRTDNASFRTRKSIKLANLNFLGTKCCETFLSEDIAVFMSSHSFLLESLRFPLGSVLQPSKEGV